MEYVQLDTPLGWFRATVEDGAGTHSQFVTGGSARNDVPAVYAALHAYFAGEVDALDAIAVHAEGTTFQKQVWDGLREIPVGQAWSYSELAEYIGTPGASRAVGL